jgi:hypothetical protein
MEMNLAATFSVEYVLRYGSLSAPIGPTFHEAYPLIELAWNRMPGCGRPAFV